MRGLTHRRRGRRRGRPPTHRRRGRPPYTPAPWGPESPYTPAPWAPPPYTPAPWAPPTHRRRGRRRGRPPYTPAPWAPPPTHRRRGRRRPLPPYTPRRGRRRGRPYTPWAPPWALPLHTGAVGAAVGAPPLHTAASAPLHTGAVGARRTHRRRGRPLTNRTIVRIMRVTTAAETGAPSPRRPGETEQTRQFGTVFKKIAAPPRTNRPGPATNQLSHRVSKPSQIRSRTVPEPSRQRPAAFHPSTRPAVGAPTPSPLTGEGWGEGPTPSPPGVRVSHPLSLDGRGLG